MVRLLSVVLLFAVSVPSSFAQKALQAAPKASQLPPPMPLPPHAILDHIRATNAVNCGVSKEEEDYTRSEDHGNRAAFDVDLCKAVAVALLGPGARLTIKSYPDEPFTLRALKAGEVDIMATASLSPRNMASGVALSAPVLLDGQGMLFPNNPRVHTAADLAGKKVCFLTGSAAEAGLHSYATAHGISFIWYPFSEAGEMEAAFFTGNCDAVTGDLTQLANIRGIDAGRAAEFTILGETMRDDPLAMASFSGDPALAAIVYWTVEVLLNAEQLHVTQTGVKAAESSTSPEVQQLLGQPFGPASELGLRQHWGADVIGAVGNYGELYDRDLGPHSNAHLERGKNRLTLDGGALYAAPLQNQ